MKRIDIDNGVVKMVYHDGSYNPNELPEGSIEVESNVVVYAKWIYDSESGTFSAPPDPVRTKTELQAYAAKKRWEVETGGITVEGISIKTDDRSKVLLNGGASGIDDETEIDFYFPSTGWVTITGAQIKAMKDAVTAHVQNCFSVNRTISNQIEADEITTFGQIDAASWPS